MERFKPFAAVYLLLINNNQVLLSRRFNTGFMDGFYSLPAGHLDEGETLTAALIRESQEEIGITPINPKLIQVVHRLPKTSEDRNYLDFFFLSTSWNGEINNLEPEKCDSVEWFDINSLPTKIIPDMIQVISNPGSKLTLTEINY